MARVLIDTSTKAISTAYSQQRSIWKTDAGKLILFANISNVLKYKTSTDNGDTWSVWTTVFTSSSTLYGFDTFMDSNNHVYVVYWEFNGFTHSLRFKKLTYSAGSWSIGSEATITTSNVGQPSITQRNNGNLWVARCFSFSTLSNVYCNISTDDGASWATTANFAYTSSQAVSLLPKDTYIWAIVQGNSKLRIYQYDSSWDAGADIAGSGITDSQESLGTLKVGNSEIYAATRTSTGVKLYKYTGSWDGGTALSDNANDQSPEINYVNNQPNIIWSDYDGSNYNIFYRRYNGSSWNSEIKLTDDADVDKYPNAVPIDTDYLYIIYTTGAGSPYSIYFDKVNLNPTLQVTILSDAKIKVTGNQENILSDAKIILDRVQETILSNAKIKGTYQSTIQSDTKIKVLDNQETILSDAEIVNRIQKTILSDAQITVDYDGKFIHNTDAFIITDTNPTQIIRVDLTNPTVYTKYNVTGKSYGKDLVINHDREYLYASLANGYVVKADTDDPSSQTIFYVDENQQLYSIVHNPTYLTTFIADGNADESLFALDEATYAKINTDLRTRANAEKQISTLINFGFGEKINTDLRFRKAAESQIQTDLRFIKEEYETIPYSSNIFARADFHVKIDAVELTDNDLKLDSIKIVHTTDNKDTADFILTRKHDDINNPTTITNNNVVTIYLKTKLEFTGRVTKLDCDSEAETVHVYCESDDVNEDYNIVTKDLPLTTLNTQLHLYDILLNTIEIDKPYIEADDENPPYYKGIKINLGTKIEENVIIWYVSHNTQKTAERIEDGTFSFVPNYTYFWQVNVERLNISLEREDLRTISNPYNPAGWVYIGTSLGSLSSDLYKIIGVDYRYQKVMEDTETDLGYYYLGVAPYKEISVKNGKKITTPKWVDKADGLYWEQEPNYDYEQYCKDVAAVEYEKLKNINGDILPKTTANVDLTIDGYLYYGLKLLTRINITNTTSANIYKNTNGFPISIKQITIDSSTMKINLNCDNTFSEWELERIEGTYPEEPSEFGDFSHKYYSKYDLSNEEFIDYLNPD